MMKGRIVGRTVLPFLLGVLIFITSGAHGAEMRKERLTINVGGKSHVISVEVAETEAQQAYGLMYRKELGRRQGMLFPYKKPRVLTMWMRNTYISLDMVFINAAGKIQRIAEATEPLSEEIISSGVPVIAVLELPAGVAAELGLKPGHRIMNKIYFPIKTQR